jgi:hypothetical protein
MVRTGTVLTIMSFEIKRVHNKKSDVRDLNVYPLIAGFCLQPVSRCFRRYDIEEMKEDERLIYFKKHDIRCWYLASLATTKCGLPLLSVKDMNYEKLQASPLSGIEMHQEYAKKMLQKIAFINGLESILYIPAWNYASSFVRSRNITRGNI